jgi:hypothetical protein
VQRFGGFVAKYMGDGVLVYFGYPQAHEDDAGRAVRAGLELVTAVGALKTHAPLETRVGVATGLVVVGDLIGSGASQEQAIVGVTRIGMVMHTGTDIDEAFRPLNQRCQKVGGQRVDREDMRRAIGCDAMPLAVATAALWITASKRPNALTWEAISLDNDRLSLSQCAPGVLRAFCIAGMEDQPTPLARKQFARH